MHDKADAMLDVSTSDQSTSPPANPVWCGPQIHAYDDVAVAVLPEADTADAMLRRLEQAGMAADQVGLAVRSDRLIRLSGLLACPAPEQDLFDTLVELSVPSAAARLYQQSFNARQAVLAVRGAGRSSELARLLESGTGWEQFELPIDAQAVERQAADRSADDATRAEQHARAAARH